MHLKIKSDITAFYDFSNCCTDNIEFIIIHSILFFIFYQSLKFKLTKLKFLYIMVL